MHQMAVFSLLYAIAISNMAAADWPTYRADASRTGYTAENVPADLHLQWTYQANHAPCPAWFAPDSRMEFDHAYQPVISGGTLFFGSSADGKVYALDAKTGRERWSIFTDGPIRFAPTVWEGRVYAVSDDGCLYCLNARNGDVIWKHQGAPGERKVLGNDRMISLWPARGGTVIADGIVYYSAGIWPTQGIFLYALDAKTGDVLWCNDSSGGIEMNQPHPTARSKSGISSQGYLVVAGEKLIVSTGRAIPAMFNRPNGEMLYFHLQKYGQQGGSEIAVYDEFFLNRGFGYQLADGEKALDLIGPQMAVTPSGIVQANNKKINASTLVLGEKTDKRGNKIPAKMLQERWGIDSGCASVSLIAAGDKVICGAPGKVTILNAQDGATVWSAQIQGRPYGLAVADGRLYVSTDRGEIHCFAVKERTPEIVSPIRTEQKSKEIYIQAAEAILKKAAVTEGYCLDLGCGDGSLTHELLKRSNLYICAVDSDQKNVERARKRLEDAGLYGIRATVHLAPLDHTNFPDYFADLIVSGRSASGKMKFPYETSFRMLHPYGGVACIGKSDDLDIRQRGPLQGAANWTHQYADAQNTGCSTDALAEGPLGMLWFRDTDHLTPNRHGRGHAPLYYEGRIFSMGVNSLRAIDAYNGRPLWDYPLPGIQTPYHQEHLMGTSGTGSNFCMTKDCIYVRLENKCLCLDPATGKLLRELTAPEHPDGDPGTWGYISCSGDTLFGSLSNTDHTVGYRFGKSDMSGMYTESCLLFALDANTGKVKWTYRPDHSIRNNTIAIGDGLVYLIDRPIAQFDRFNRGEEPKEKEHAFGRLAALDAETGEVRWQSKEHIYGTMLSVSLKHDVLLMAYQATRFQLLSEVGGRMAAFRASTGDKLWDIQADYASRPLINDNKIYAQPGAWDLLTGEPTGFKFTRSYGCGIISGSRNLLVFRSGTMGYIDLQESNETRNYGGTRVGCWINALPAGGLVLVPNGWSICKCSYLIRADLALQNQ